MRIAIAGSRGLVCDDLLSEILENHPGISEIVSGTEPTGVDAVGERWAEANGVPVRRFPPDWNRYEQRSTTHGGNPAGHARNEEMAAYCDGAVVIWDGKSPGTRDMLHRLRRHGKPVDLIRVDVPRLVF